MDVTQEYPDVLQNIEFFILKTFKEQPEIRDPDVILALERLIGLYTREKKGLPALPVNLPGKSKPVFDAIVTACDMQRGKAKLTSQDGEQIEMPVLPIRILILCLERLHKSAVFWHKNNGQRGYLSYISNFIG